MRSVKTVCLTNQEEFGHETNFHAFYTQQGVRNNWNHLQGYSDQEDMNFTNRRFSNPSICEYPSLEFVSSPKKKRSDPKQNVYFKIDLLSSQQAQEEAKRRRKSQDTIILPEPVKPSNLWKDWTINWSNCFQTELNQPGRILHDPRLPEYTSNRPEEPPLIFPYTSKHRISRIFIYNNLPYRYVFPKRSSEDQRLYCFDYCLLNTFRMNLDVPRHQSFPTKLSRLKRIITFLIFGQASHLRPNGYFLLFLILFLISSIVLLFLSII